MTEQQTAEQKEANYEVHEMALQFPKQTEDEKAQLRENMIQRVQRGLAPLESPILLAGGKIADGRHRYEIWQELAAEGACDGYFAKNQPPVEESTVNDEQDGEAAILLRINSRNLCQRSLPADQKAAIFLQQLDKFPCLKLQVEQIQIENQERMKAGKPLDNKSQGTTTNEQVGKLAGVSASTIKLGKRLQKEAPQQLSKVARGEASFSGSLKEVTATKVNGANHKAEGVQAEKPKATTSNTKRKPPIELLPKKDPTCTNLAVLAVTNVGQVAEVREFFDEEKIRHDVKQDTNETVFSFKGTGADQIKLLTFVANMVAAKGPVRLSMHVTV